MIIDVVQTLKLTKEEMRILKDCQELLTKIVEESNKLNVGGEFDGIDSYDIDETISSLLKIYDIAEEYFGV